MRPDEVRSAADAREIVEERRLNHVKVGLFDVDGVMRGKYMSREKFYSALEKGFGFCDVVLGWDSNDQLYEKPGVQFTGWHTGYPDAQVRILPDTCRELPYEDGMLLFLAEFAGEAEAICPRGLLRRVLARAAAQGLHSRVAFEYEFFLFRETPDSVREKRYRDLQPVTPGFFGYSMLRSSVHADWYHDLLGLCEAMDFPLEGLHTETGPGVLEAAINVDEGLRAADKAALFKTFTKVWAQRNDMLATFMARWSNDYPGQSGHIHMSLYDSEGASLFHEVGAEHGMSDAQRYFVGGQQRLMPELLAMLAQTVNSYTRLVPGFWAPTDATWGVENRTTALRVVPGGAQSQRVEYRLGSADANPYIALAAALGAGLYGLQHKVEPAPQVKGSAYEQQHPAVQALPRTLDEASARLRASGVARELFGDAFVDHFATTREWEQRQFDRSVTDWELQRYFEII